MPANTIGKMVGDTDMVRWITRPNGEVGFPSKHNAMAASAAANVTISKRALHLMSKRLLAGKVTNEERRKYRHDYLGRQREKFNTPQLSWDRPYRRACRFAFMANFCGLIFGVARSKDQFVILTCEFHVVTVGNRVAQRAKCKVKNAEI